MTLYSGSLPAGSRTVPLIDVVAVPVRFGTLQAMPVQAPLVMLGQTFGTRMPPVGGAAPHVPIGQVMGQVKVPPQPSPIVPQYWPPPVGLQVIFLQLGSPHTLATPWPPQVAGDVHAPQSIDPPQPSPMVAP